jgi:hypothetical protein
MVGPSLKFVKEENGEWYKRQRRALCYEGCWKGWQVHYSWKEDVDFAGYAAGYAHCRRRRTRLSNKVKDFVSCLGISRRFENKVIIRRRILNNEGFELLLCNGSTLRKWEDEDVNVLFSK